jgi:hypothetical protein
LWQLQSQSSEPNCEILFISTDGLDQAKFALPRHPDLKANAAVFLGWFNIILICFRPMGINSLTPNVFPSSDYSSGQSMNGLESKFTEPGHLATA